ncbi:MAG: alpha/beta fold hydrolase [Pseudomonadales bacterium]|nr:alpha/beta fold hydrolase [Pseudomonadales bacterium]
MSDTVFIPGPAGRLEAEIVRATQSAGAANASNELAVLCHPHPGYGGSRHDAVLDCLARALGQRGVDVLRFNFRGVGASGGSIQGDGAEVDDLLAVTTWVGQELSPARLWLGGYSFGAAVVWQALDSLDPCRVLLIAPPVGRMHFAPRTPAMPVHVFAGSDDEFVDAPALQRLHGLTVVSLAGADHFFSGQHEDLAKAIAEVL